MTTLAPRAIPAPHITKKAASILGLSRSKSLNRSRAKSPHRSASSSTIQPDLDANPVPPVPTSRSFGTLDPHRNSVDFFKQPPPTSGSKEKGDYPKSESGQARMRMRFAGSDLLLDDMSESDITDLMFPSPRMSLPPTPSTAGSKSIHGSPDMSREDQNIPPWVRRGSEKSIPPVPIFSFNTIVENPVNRVNKQIQEAIDDECFHLRGVLQLSLVYLVSLSLSTVPGEVTVVSASGLPNPPPYFDPHLHLRALRAPEGGLLYKAKPGSGGFGYSTGILLPVGERDGYGYLLCGYTSEVGREFCERDVRRMKKSTEQVARSIAKL
ncbi:hypothetical protein T439DRAFT_376062 [Meredithblackwellia eburnea MCA 4105]